MRMSAVMKNEQAKPLADCCSDIITAHINVACLLKVMHFATRHLECACEEDAAAEIQGTLEIAAEQMARIHEELEGLQRRLKEVEA